MSVFLESICLVPVFAFLCVCALGYVSTGVCVCVFVYSSMSLYGCACIRACVWVSMCELSGFLL